MADVFTKEQRSKVMSAIRAKNTAPEMRIRRAIHRLGFRYRLHNKKLPGSPDLVFPKYGAIIFVNGCFWHGHTCLKNKSPQTRREYWIPKIERNKKRDKINIRKLRRLGWRCLTVWECQKADEQVIRRIIRFLKQNSD